MVCWCLFCTLCCSRNPSVAPWPLLALPWALANFRSWSLCWLSCLFAPVWYARKWQNASWTYWALAGLSLLVNTRRGCTPQYILRILLFLATEDSVIVVLNSSPTPVFCSALSFKTSELLFSFTEGMSGGTGLCVQSLPVWMLNF